MNALDTLLTRASSSRLALPVPEGEALDRILAAAARAPDHGGLRPWRLLVISRARGLVRLAEAGEASLRRRQPEADADARARIREKLTRAPMVIVLGGQIVPGHKIPEEEQVLAVGAAGMNILNALHALGFAGKWVTGPHCADRGCAADLGYDPTDRLFGLLMVGTPEAARREADRVVDDLVRRWSS